MKVLLILGLLFVPTIVFAGHCGGFRSSCDNACDGNYSAGNSCNGGNSCNSGTCNSMSSYEIINCNDGTCNAIYNLPVTTHTQQLPQTKYLTPDNDPRSPKSTPPDAPMGSPILYLNVPKDAVASTQWININIKGKIVLVPVINGYVPQIQNIRGAGIDGIITERICNYDLKIPYNANISLNFVTKTEQVVQNLENLGIIAKQKPIHSLVSNGN